MERNFNGNSGKVAVYIFKKDIRINIGPMASTAEKNRKQRRKFLFDVLNYNFLKTK